MHAYFSLIMLDALISLPIFSFFLLPLWTSWTTQLNLAFFYMTWATFVMSHPAYNVEVVGTLFIRLIFYVIPALAFLAFDCLVPSISTSIKAHGDDALPRRLGRKKVAKVVGVSLANVLLGVAAQAGIELLATRVLHVRSVVRINIQLPYPWDMWMDVAKAFVIRNILQYYIHFYVLHRSRTPVAKYHASWHHSLPLPFSIAATYDHPLPYLIGHWLPTFIPAALFRFHLLTYFLFLGLVSLEDLFTWSGYTVLPSHILMTGMARRRDAHMLSSGQGNFAPWGVLDWAHGTGLGKDVVDDLKAEAEKRDVKGKASNGVEKGGVFLDEAGEKMKRRGRAKR
ncbi:hypothetical protein EJ05DRAFT_100205 [Pseudovirgaria hyperparasitica]|uniref:Fatty acid hydroxylase domain-containing protein n=1 Tax=Pseudovirgaria hyperparasitica TaxID=470096 RepID=A0A6A6VXK1_9PEZI|nr:uncharacterized protein EJ05DRAFT_100205 [Pseudovirgaria hyperparasitica]KAF2755398.1 hypothetical protein EJ05DRAFT_100205 [Pseudovirgaria hyperparasitica]